MIKYQEETWLYYSGFVLSFSSTVCTWYSNHNKIARKAEAHQRAQGMRGVCSRSCLLLHFLRQQDVQTSYSFSHIIAMPVRIATMMISMRSGNKHMIRAGIPHSP